MSLVCRQSSFFSHYQDQSGTAFVVPYIFQSKPQNLVAEPDQFWTHLDSNIIVKTKEVIRGNCNFPVSSTHLIGMVAYPFMAYRHTSPARVDSARSIISVIQSSFVIFSSHYDMYEKHSPMYYDVSSTSSGMSVFHVHVNFFANGHMHDEK